MKTLTVKIPEPLFAEISNAAKLRKMTKSAIIRERLEQKSEPQVSSLWSRMSDLVIDSEELPPDLSSNKKHLKGYGKNRSTR